MTLSQRAKNEIIKSPPDEGYALAELSAIIHTAGSIIISKGNLSIEVISETQDLSRRIQNILKTLYGAGVKTGDDFVIGRHMYKTLIPESVAPMVLKDCSILELNDQGGLSIVKGIDKHLVMDLPGKYAYIRGVFLGGGYIADGKNYRLEFVFSTQELSEDFKILLNDIGINSKNILRKNKYVLYLSSSEYICDLLAGIGANATVLHIYNEIANRSVRNVANRTANCISANIDKAVDTAVRQSKAIEIIEKNQGLDYLPDKLKQAALARKQNPSATLQEIAEKLNLSKSGLNHRMTKIIEISNKITEDNDAE
jgi:DNA-binding protein WhiA